MFLFDVLTVLLLTTVSQPGLVAPVPDMATCGVDPVDQGQEEELCPAKKEIERDAKFEMSS